jgi:hypothetical protein
VETSIHCFEKSGLGKAPFRCVGLYSIPSPSLAEHNVEAYNNALRDMPRDVGCGSCQYCGTAIMHNFIIQSSDGMRFVVGSDCVARTGDAGLLKQVRGERLKVVREKREAGRRMKREEREAGWAAERAARAATFAVEHAALLAQAEPFLGNPFVGDVIKRGLAGGYMSDRAIETLIRVVNDLTQQAQNRINSKHVGVVGKRQEWSVRVERTAGYFRPSFAGYGQDYVHIITMRDEAGNALVSKGSFSAERGAQLVIKATVKAHDEYQGEKQTIVQRVVAK